MYDWLEGIENVVGNATRSGPEGDFRLPQLRPEELLEPRRRRHAVRSYE